MKTIDLAFVEGLLTKYQPNPLDQVDEAVSYALLGGGKRIRPIFLFKTAQLFGEIDQNVERLAVALEMVHNYSLVHDDLPCMDDDDLRRGKPTCHVKFGDATAVLAGDSLLSCAVETIFGGNPSAEYFAAAAYLFAACGRKGMIHGQALDVAKDFQSVGDLLDIAEHKTAKLFQAALVCPTIYFGADAALISSFENVARIFGRVFQIADDLSDSEKPDETSFVSLIGEAQTRALLRKEVDMLFSLCSNIDADLSFLTDFCRDIVQKL